MWELTDELGTWHVEHDGYQIEVAELLARPGFFVTHVAEKAWGKPDVVAALVDRAVQLAKFGLP